MLFNLMWLRRWPAALCLCMAVAAAAENTAKAPAATVIDGLGKGTFRLNGPWQFHTGDDPAWAAPGFDDSGWEQLRGSDGWDTQGHPGYTGFAWYRLHLTMNEAPGVKPDFALLVYEVQDTCEIYWNGALIGHDGKLPPHPVWSYNRPALTFGLGPEKSGVLAVRVWKAPLGPNDARDWGGLPNAPVVGSAGAISSMKEAFDYYALRSKMFDSRLHQLYVLVALLSLVAWLRDRGQWRLFWITAYSLFPLVSLFFSDMRLAPTNIVSGWMTPISALHQIALWFLLLWLLQLHENRRLVRLTQALAVVGLAAAALEGLVEGWAWSVVWNTHWVAQVRAADGVLLGITSLINCLPLVLVIAAAESRRRLDHSGWIFSGFACLQVTLLILESDHIRAYAIWVLGDRVYNALFNNALFEMSGASVDMQTVVETLVLLSIVYAVYRYWAENQHRQTALEQEFKSAREVQQVLIPETVPTVPGFALTSAYRPAQEVGGDFFQIIPLEDKSTLVVLGDVSGKGLRAAMAVSLIVGVVHTLAEGNPSPAQLLALLNRRLIGRLQGGFATCVALRLESDGAATVASAGHPSPLINGRDLDLPGALPLGLAAATMYPEFPFHLHVNDHLSLFTDGLLEARNPAGELFSFERLKALFAGKPTATEATQAAVDFGQEDDITVVTLTRLASGYQSTSTFSLRTAMQREA